MIEVVVQLFPPLRINRFDRSTVSLIEPATVASLLQNLSIKEREVESVYVNGRGATFEQHLVSGDRVTLLPTIGGG